MYRNLLVLPFVLLGLFALSTSTLAQKGTVAGTITSNEGGSVQPLPFVNVVLKGTTTGATTDLDGKFSFPADPGTHTLQVSFVGYEPAERIVNVVADQRTIADVEMKTQGIEMKEFEVVKIADEIGRPCGQVSLRWLMQQKVVTIPIFSARTAEQAKEDLGACDFTLTDEQMRRLTVASMPAIQSIMPNSGAYPYPMLEYGSPALPEFYSRGLLFGNIEEKIINHRRIYGYQYHRTQPAPSAPAPVLA